MTKTQHPYLYVSTAWLLLSILILLSYAGAADSAGGELAMLMSVVAMPASILTGILLNAINYSPEAKGFLSFLLVWLPFSAMGLFQWLALTKLILTLKQRLRHARTSTS